MRIVIHPINPKLTAKYLSLDYQVFNFDLPFESLEVLKVLPEVFEKEVELCILQIVLAVGVISL
jgi:hypothetical protein